jgi:cysteinyl-tRNA synthetase
VKVFNTLSGEKEEFLPQGSEVKMYVCGVTPYDECHIGHAMSYIIFDVIRRYLKFRGYRVKYVQNVTDIDDKIIDRAAQRGVKASELAQRYTDSFFEDMDALNIERADFYPYATGEIDKIIEVIGGLIDKGHAYPAGGSVYFRVKSSPDYGKLSRRSLESMMSSCSLEMGKEKEHPMDFALWKAAKPGEPYWKSPWGQGRPGWHIECSAMSLKYLGDSLDIHGGGQDLIFPHHENEIAQSECFTGTKPFVRYWLHNGMVQFGEEKMSKSLGNLITIKEALEKYGADALRIFVLSSHYRSPLTYSEVTLQATEVALRIFRDAKWKLTEPHSEINRSMLEAQGVKTDDITAAKSYYNRFISAMDDDFNTAQALATLFDLAQEINRAVNLGHEDKITDHRKIFKQLADVLGLLLPEPKTKDPELDTEPFSKLQDETISKIRRAKLDKLINEVCTASVNTAVSADDVKPYINWLVDIRTALRKQKQFQLSDEIRAALDELGIILEDTPTDTFWRYKI